MTTSAPSILPRRRWHYGLTLVTFLFFVIVLTGLFISISSPATIDDKAIDAFIALEMGVTRHEVEAIMGPAHSVFNKPEGGFMLYWKQSRNGWNDVETSTFVAWFDSEGKLWNRGSGGLHRQGWRAWIARWDRLKTVLGFN